MDDIKKTVRDVETDAKSTWRKSDGDESVADCSALNVSFWDLPKVSAQLYNLCLRPAVLPVTTAGVLLSDCPSTAMTSDATIAVSASAAPIPTTNSQAKYLGRICLNRSDVRNCMNAVVSPLM